MTSHCLVCRREFDATTAYCYTCDLPVIDATAIKAVRAHQIHTALMLVLRRAESEYRMLGPMPVIRDTRHLDAAHCHPIRDGVFNVIADVLSTLRSGFKALRQSIQGEDYRVGRGMRA